MVLKSKFADVVIPEIPLGQYMMDALKQQDPDALAIIEMHSGNSITFKQLHDQAQQLTGLLWRAGLRKGDIVGLVFPFDLKYTPLFIAISCCGGVLFGCKLLFQSSIANQLRSIKPTLVIVADDRYDEISADLNREVPSVKLCLSFDEVTNVQAGSIRSRDDDMPCYGSIDVHNDAAVIYQSSGTTGQPKGIVTTHYGSVASLTTLKTIFRFADEITIAICMKIFHVLGLSMFLSCASQGITLAYASSLNAKQHLEFTAKYKITTWIITNVNYFKGILGDVPMHRYDLSSLKCILGSGTTFPSEMIQKARDKFKILVSMLYGSSEMGFVSRGYSNKTPTKSVGLLSCNNQVKVIKDDKELGPNDTGEICVKSPQIMKKYLIDDEAVNQAVKDGWMHSGDLGYYDKQGYLYVVGRLKEAIKIQPLNVIMMPAELEDVIRRHNKVIDVAIVGVAHPDYGEAPRAFVVRKDESLQEEDVVKFFNDQVENVTSLHGGVEFVSTIPRTEIGKILRWKLIEKLHN